MSIYDPSKTDMEKMRWWLFDYRNILIQEDDAGKLLVAIHRLHPGGIQAFINSMLITEVKEYLKTGKIHGKDSTAQEG